MGPYTFLIFFMLPFATQKELFKTNLWAYWFHCNLIKIKCHLSFTSYISGYDMETQDCL